MTQIKEGEHITGNRTKVKVVKNKVAPPFRDAEFDIIYGEGISRLGEIIDLGVEQKVVEKAGSWFSYKGERLGQGRENVKNLLRENRELAAKIEGEVRQALGIGRGVGQGAAAGAPVPNASTSTAPSGGSTGRRSAGSRSTDEG